MCFGVCNFNFVKTVLLQIEFCVVPISNIYAQLFRQFIEIRIYKIANTNSVEQQYKNRFFGTH